MLRKRDIVKDLKKLPSDYFRHLYFDTSGSPSKAALLGALEIVDAAHIIWGSDYPANQNLWGAIEVVKGVLNAPAEQAGIYYRNAVELF
jgi:predicted TIM-barrel fold metal-dependent hydrolase